MKETEGKEAINSLELWLRNLIDRKLSEAYGQNYLYAKNTNNQNIIKSQLRKDIEKRIQGQEERYPRKVDALLLDEEIEIICHPELYKKHFKEALDASFPDGNNVARTYLNQLKPIRNKLFHSNPISQREYEKVICYSHDVIDSIKDYYKKINMEKEFNVPSILSIEDSLGNVVHENQFIKLRRSRPVCTESQFNKSTLHVGDILEIKVNIDEAFSKETYEVKWLYMDEGSAFKIKEQLGEKFLLKLKEKHIREQFQIECIVKSNKTWHRFTKHDDMVLLNYKVLPVY